MIPAHFSFVSKIGAKLGRDNPDHVVKMHFSALVNFMFHCLHLFHKYVVTPALGPVAEPGIKWIPESPEAERKRDR